MKHENNNLFLIKLKYACVGEPNTPTHLLVGSRGRADNGTRVFISFFSRCLLLLLLRRRSNIAASRPAHTKAGARVLAQRTLGADLVPGPRATRGHRHALHAKSIDSPRNAEIPILPPPLPPTVFDAPVADKPRLHVVVPKLAPTDDDHGVIGLLPLEICRDILRHVGNLRGLLLVRVAATTRAAAAAAAAAA